MAMRPMWTGFLKLSLVSCPVALFAAATASEKVSFHLLNRATGHRLKQQYVDAETGDIVEHDERIKGYEIAKDDYVEVTDDDLAKVHIESNHAIDIDRFVAKREIDPIYLDNHFYLAPNDANGAEAFAVIREAMRARDMVGLARVVLFGRERPMLIEPRAAGLMATTLRYAYEVRDDAAVFGDIPEMKPARDLLDLAAHIIDTKIAAFEPSRFADRYQDALVALIRAKKDGEPIPASKEDKAPGNVVSLMDALRRSLGDTADLAKGAKSRTTVNPKAAKKKSAASNAKTGKKPSAGAGKPARRKAAG